MKREATLGVLAVLVLAATVGVALLAPGAVAEKSDATLRPSDIDLHEPRVSAGRVGGETVDLTLDVRMAHGGGPARNVTVEVQAVDSDTGLVATTVRKRLGRITGNREVRTLLNVTVARQGGYRLDIRVYENGSRVETGRTSVSGVASLTPDYADTPVEFHRFGSGEGSPPVISYSTRNTADNRTTLRTQTYLTNRGDAAAGNLELIVMARQAESNLVADRATVSVGEIGPGRTVTPTATLEVPTDYNYYLDGVLMKDGVVVGTATSAAMLDPTRPVPKNETTEAVEFSAGDFDSATPEPVRDEDRPRGTTVASGPGFGVAVTVAALLALAVAVSRRNP